MKVTRQNNMDNDSDRFSWSCCFGVIIIQVALLIYYIITLVK